MAPEILLAQLRALLGRAPDFAAYAPSSHEHLVWLGQAHALLARWDWQEASAVQVAADFLPLARGSEMNIAKIFGAIHRAIADLELKVPVEKQLAFGAGEVYDFFRALRSVIESAEASLFVIDPYLDSTIFDQYLSSRNEPVLVRLLTKQYAHDVKGASEKYASQFGNVVEVRSSNAIHDRVIFVDDAVCWVMGQSIKDAAKAKPTYLIPLPPDVTLAKLHDYSGIWNAASAI